MIIGLRDIFHSEILQFFNKKIEYFKNNQYIYELIIQ